MPRPHARRPALALATLLALPLAARAQEAPAPAPDADAVQEITVTARRRAEPLQSVPVAVSVINGAQANQEDLNNLQDITQQVPSADFRAQSSNKDRTIFVRGIGTISTSPGVEPSVSTVIDGVVLARSGQATDDIIGLDRVEVLRGPQGTLFGKNASAGVINITTAAPSDQFHAWADAGYFFSGGSEYRAEAGVTGAITPELRGVISVLSTGFDGNVENLYKDRTVNGYERNGFRAKLDYVPSDDLRVDLALDYLKSIDTVPNGVFVSTQRVAYPTGIVTRNPALARLLGVEGIVPGTDNRVIDNDQTSDANDDNGGIALTIDKKLGDYDLTSITAYRAWSNVQRQDYDQLPAPTASFPGLRDRGTLTFEQFSQEARIASPKGGLIDWVGGLYYLLAVDNEEYQRGITSITKGKPVFNNGDARYGTDGNDVAIFGESDINVTSDFRGILGARLVYDDLTYTFGRVSSSRVALTGIRPDFHSDGKVSHFDYTVRAGLQYDLTEDANVYFTYSRGYKGPAFDVFFNMQPQDTITLKPETNNSYELGLKSALFDHRVQADFALFKEDFSNYQANFSDTVAGAIVTRLVNAGSVSTRGFEGDLTTRPLTGLDVSGAFAYTDAYIDQFNCPPGAASSCDVNGEPLPFAPLWKFTARAQQTIHVTDQYDLAVGTDFSWQTKTQFQLTETPDTVQKDYGLWNAVIALTSLEDDWRVSGVVRNILDTHYSTYLGYGNLGGVIRYVPRDDRRYFGIEFRKDF